MRIKLNWYVVLLVILFCFSKSIQAEDLPRAAPENCFYIMPLFEQLRVPGIMTFEEKRAQFIKMKQQLGNGNLYHRLGFSGIYAPGVDAEVRENCKLAKEYGVHFGLIFADQSHTRNDLRNVAANDLRMFQWRKDGVDWKGAYTVSGNLEVPENERDYKIPTPSRLAIPLQVYNAAQVKAWAVAVKKLMDDYPGVISCINGPIEEELAIGGNADQNKLADYSPFAITEFRDWLRHKGIYDDSSGKYAGEGAISLIVGNLITINGTLRSQFYDDTTPADNNGSGVSFNTFFGTNFTSWNLRYWDLENFPAAITDENFDCTPETGQGFTSGGFDAPRTIGTDKFWRAWSYEINDQGGSYPQGNPATPAFGFRQNMVRNFVRDLFDVLNETGLPRRLMYAHQIPGEALSAFTGGNTRLRSSASTVWTGYLEKSQTVGITRFSAIDPEFITQYVGDWGIFEWHTSPNTDANSQVLYTKSATDLTNYYTHKCHYLFPGWWKHIPNDDLRFPLNDSRFADAISDFMKARTELPYNQQGTVHDYNPPVVTGVFGYFENNTLKVSWNNKIWSDLLPNWSDWSGFSYFEIQKSTDGASWGTAERANNNQYSQTLSVGSWKVRVRAVSKTGLTGNWSEPVTIDINSKQYTVSPQYYSMAPNPELTNRITISLTDVNQVISPESLNISISGEGFALSSEPENVASIDKFWPMNSISEITGMYRLDNAACADGLFQAIVSPITPIDPYFSFSGSKIDGSKLPYISLMVYSDVASEGRIYWFISGGNKSVTFSIQPGWNKYSFSNLPEWTAQTVINSVRLDPGITASAKVILDWFAISSQPISATLKPSALIEGSKATLITSPTSKPGSYTVKVSLNGGKQDVVISTSPATGNRQANLLIPNTILYPNPATNQVNLRIAGSSKNEVSIFSLSGQLIKEYFFSDQLNPIFSVAELPKGLYLVQVNGETGTFTEKLIIK